MGFVKREIRVLSCFYEVYDRVLHVWDDCMLTVLRAVELTDVVWQSDHPPEVACDL